MLQIKAVTICNTKREVEKASVCYSASVFFIFTSRYWLVEKMVNREINILIKLSQNLNSLLIRLENNFTHKPIEKIGDKCEISLKSTRNAEKSDKNTEQSRPTGYLQRRLQGIRHTDKSCTLYTRDSPLDCEVRPN